MNSRQIFSKSSFSNDLKKLGYYFDLKDPKCTILGEGSFGKVGLYKNKLNKYKAIKIIDIANYIEHFPVNLRSTRYE